MKVAVGILVLAVSQAAIAAPSSRQAVVAAMTDSAAGWDAGDLKRFMAIYSDDPATSYVVKDGIVSGKAAIERSYAPRFAPGMAMKRGTLSFDTLRFVTLDPTHALLVAVPAQICGRQGGDWRNVAGVSSRGGGLEDYRRPQQLKSDEAHSAPASAVALSFMVLAKRTICPSSPPPSPARATAGCRR